MNIKAIFVRFGLAAVLALGTAAAQATLVYDFEVTIDANGTPIQNQSFTGSLSFDDSVSTGTLGFGDELYALTSFSFTFDGVAYTEADLSPAEVAVLNGVLVGVEGGELNGVFAFLSALPVGQPASFSYDLGVGNAGFGEVVYALVPGVLPEPGGAMLALAALGALAVRLRKPPHAVR